MIVKDNEIKLSQYGQWDGYPRGNGIIVLNWLKTKDINLLAEKIKNLKTITEDELKQAWVDCGAAPDDKFVTQDVAEAFKKKYPQLSRGTGAGILDMVLNSDSELLVNDDTEFAKDGLFCEWAYLLNLDTKELEVYKGFNETPLSPDDRFYFNGYVSNGGYYPIKLVKKYPFTDFPTDDDFCMDLEPESE